jgi:hypothetical protein
LFNMPLTSRSKQQQQQQQQQQPATVARYSSISEVPSDDAPPPAQCEDVPDTDWMFYAFCCMSCLVAGMVDGASLAGVYLEATSHLSGISTKMALRMNIPPPFPTAARARNLGVLLPFWAYFLLVCTFGLGSLVCGFVLVENGVHGQPLPRHINVTLGRGMQASHRALIAACTALLSLSSLVIHCIDTHRCFFAECSSPGAIFAQTLLSMTLASAACGILNGITSCSNMLIFRSSHMTGTITDVFLLVGYCMRVQALPRLQLVRLLVSEEKPIRAIFGGCGMLFIYICLELIASHVACSCSVYPGFASWLAGTSVCMILDALSRSAY